MIVVGHDTATHQPLVVGDEHHCLVLGPPRSGKTSAFLVPSVLTHDGPVVAASSKPDVLEMCLEARRRAGPVWVLDIGSNPVPRGVERCGWSPVPGCEDEEVAVLRARSMVGATDLGGDHQDGFWRRMAERLLGALLHAAALADLPVEDLARWLLVGDLAEPAALLQDHDAQWACGLVVGIDEADPRLRDSIVVTASECLRVYDTARARAQAAGELFPVERFLLERGTLFVIAPGDVQSVVSPIVVGLVDEIRRRAYAGDHPAALFALDEVTSIAPLPTLPTIASEGGSQGVQLLVVLHALAQARRRWPADADSFLTLFPHKVLLPGVLEDSTISGLSRVLGEDYLPTSGAPLVRPRWSAHDLVAGPGRTAVHIDGGVARRVAVVGFHDLAYAR